MSLSRDELAARFAVALVGAGRSIGAVEEAFRQADTFLSALAPKPDEAPPPVATPAYPVDAVTPAAPALEPRRTVGAVVKGPSSDVEFIVVADNEVRRVSNGNKQTAQLFDFDTFVRWATREECEDHGIPFVDRTPPAPAPTVAPLTAEERVDLAKAMRDAWFLSWYGRAPEVEWDDMVAADRIAYLAEADAAAAWFQRRGGAK